MNIKYLSVVLLAGIIITGAGCSKSESPISDPKNTSYYINNETTTLKNGKSEQQLPTRPVVIKTSIFETTKADINGDGLEDTVVLLTQDQGGSGTFYYVVVAVNSNNGYQGSNAVFLGDRIAPQNIRVENGKIEVNYATRNLNDSFTTPPSVGATKYLVYNSGKLEEVTSDVIVGQQITAQLGDHYHAATSTLTVSFDNVSEKFAKGTVNLEGQGGAVWLAAKTLEGWKVVWVGNGIVTCASIDRYDFPVTLLPNCLDAKNNLIKRK